MTPPGSPSRGPLRSLGRVQGQLGLEGIPSRLVRVTPARLATWAGCPRKYRMTYLDKPTPPRAGARAHSTLGAVVHNALRAFFELRPAQRTPERAAELVGRCWKSDGFESAQQAAEWRERARGWVADYVRETDVDAPVALERWVSAPVGSIIAEGRVDRIDRRGEELVVVDYKTGRRALTTADARESRALALYALAARTTLRGPCRRVELHHLPSGSVVSWEHTEDTLTEHLRSAEQLAAELRSAGEAHESGQYRDEELFPPRVGRHCSWCDFRAHCPEGRQAAPESSPAALLGE